MWEPCHARKGVFYNKEANYCNTLWIKEKKSIFYDPLIDSNSLTRACFSELLEYGALIKYTFSVLWLFMCRLFFMTNFHSQVFIDVT